ncbi:hypothetical protein ACHAXH_002576 [Discostella pseudostelligera]
MQLQIQQRNCGKIARFAIAAIFLLHRALCSSELLSFVPASTTKQNTESKFLLVRTTSFLSTKPYFAEYATESADTNIRIGDANSIISNDQRSGVGKTAIIAGSTGYIGRACVRECVARGYSTIALVRDVSRASTDEALNRASLVECDVTNEIEVRNLFVDIVNGKYVGAMQEKGGRKTSPPPVDIVISCLASPSGIESEVHAIDYQATLNVLNAGRNPSVKARHFVLLSAFCCRNPILKLQQAKLEFEKRLSEQNEMTYSIVRPTAFFKSVSGQYESILQGNSYVLFGDGAATQCNPIAEEDLAKFMCDSALEEYKDQRWGKILNVGGPDAPLTNKMLGETAPLIMLLFSQKMMFRAINKPAKFVYVPTQVFDLSISMIELFAKLWPSPKWKDVLETAKIGKYYAVEDMLTTEEDEKFGSIRMMDHFEKIAREGQDPFTPVRATAVISKTLEALPAVSISVPLGFGLLSKPDLVQDVISPNSLANVHMMLAGLSDTTSVS